jgi:serine protease Do
VEKGSAADKAGIEVGDIILKFDGKAVNESSDLPRMVGSTRPGTKVRAAGLAQGCHPRLPVTVGEIPDDEDRKQVAGRGSKPAEPQAANRLGLVLAVPTAEQKKALDIQHGLIVEEVKNSGSRSEVRAGDIILSAIVKGSTQVDIKSLSQFNDMLKGLDKNATMTLLVKRGDSQTFVTIKGASDK